MKSLYKFIFEKLKLTKDSKQKEYPTIEGFLNKYGFKCEYKNANTQFYKSDSEETFIKYYNKFEKIIKDIAKRSEVYEKDIDLDIKKYCLKYTIEENEYRLKICESIYKDSSGPAILSIIMYDVGEKELIYRYMKSSNDKVRQYLENKIIDLLEKIFNS